MSSTTVQGQSVPLGTAQSFAIVGGSTITNTGATTVNGDVGLSPGTSITGLLPANVVGTIYINPDAVAVQARADFRTAYNTLVATASTSNLTGQNLGGLTLSPGVYRYNSSAFLTGDLNLATGVDPNAVFIFQIGSTLTTASASSVFVTGAGATSANIFWQVGSSATFGTTTAFVGNVLADISVTFNNGASLTNGRVFAYNGAVTLDTNQITAPLLAPAAPGRYWNGYADRLWSNLNWSSTVSGVDQINLGSNVDVIFSVNPAPQNQNTILDADTTISSLTINDSANVTIGNPLIGGPRTLTIAATGLVNGITVNSGAGLVTIGSNLNLGNLSQIITVNNNAGMLISGSIASVSGLTKAGTGVLTLTGVETYTGATVVSAGTLQLGDGVTTGTSIASSSSVLVSTFDGDDGILAINLANNETFGNSVTDNGQIHWIQAGTNTQASSSIFSGTGSMEITGSGTTVLLGTNSFEGGTTIDTPGTVLVGSTTSTSSAFGTGVLTILDGYVDTNNSQVLQINVGGYVQSGGEIGMHLQGTAPGSYTQYNVAGSATLSGGTVFVYDLSGVYVPHGGDEQNIITTTTGRSGQFSSNAPFSRFYNAEFDQEFFYHQGNTLLYPTITYDEFNADVTWVQDSFASIPDITPNQGSVGDMLDEVVALNPGNPGSVVDFLNGQDISDLNAMYDLIAPDELTAIFQMGFSGADLQNSNIIRHLDLVRKGGGYTTSNETTSYQSDSKGGMSAQTTVTHQNPNRLWNIFVEGSNASASVDSSSNASGYDFDMMGITIGADKRVSDNFVFGVLGSYNSLDAGLFNNGSIEGDSYKVAIYGTYYDDGFFVNALIGGGYNSYDTRRASLLGDAEGSPDGWELNSLINVGYDIQKGNWTITPFASVSYTRVTLNSFTETGSLSPLNYPTQHQDSLRSDLGVKLSYEAKVNGMTFTPQVRVAWQHEFLDSTQSIDARLASGPGPMFTVDGPEIGRDRAMISAGLNVMLTDSVSIYAFYDTQLGSSISNSNNVSIGLNVSF